MLFYLPLKGDPRPFSQDEVEGCLSPSEEKHSEAVKRGIFVSLFSKKLSLRGTDKWQAILWAL